MTTGRPDVVVIGGGIAGANCALHLAEAGADAVLVERDRPAEKASGRAAGILTTYRTEEFGSAASAYSREFYDRLAADHDAVTLHRAPLYRVAHSEEGADRLATLAEESTVAGDLLSPEAFGEREPAVNTDGVTAALSFGVGAHLDPYSATVAVVEDAADAGATVHTGEAVTGIERTDGGFAVHGERREYRAPAVVNAAGAWAPRVAADLGVEVPLQPRTSQIATLDPPGEIDLPILSFPDLGMYARREPNGDVLIGGGASTFVDDDELDAFSTQARESFLQEVAETAPGIARPLAEAGLSNHWAGRCSSTPGRVPLIGESEVQGFYLCAGFNGEGISFSPFAGRLIADLVTGREPRFDPDRFDPTRFDAEEVSARNAIDW